MKSLLIINPTAGQGRPSETIALVEETFRASVRKLVVTSGRGDAETAAFEASSSGEFDEVLVAGGDGTVNEVVNGLMRGRKNDEPTIPLGLIPLGTQNVLAQELGFRGGDLDRAESAILRSKTFAMDIGVASASPLSPAPSSVKGKPLPPAPSPVKGGGVDSRYFTLMAGFGFDAAVVNEVVAPIKELIGPAAYAFATLGALAKYHSTKVRLELDDEEVETDAFLVIAANASSYAFRQIKLAPFASLDDGWLDVCVFERPPLDKVGFATQMMAAIAGRHLRDPRVRYYRARRVKIDSDPPVDGQVDGDVFRPTPVTISILPRALTVYVPG